MPLSISTEDWNCERQRPNNIYLKKFKKLNRKLDKVKLQITEFICLTNRNGTQNVKRALAKEIKEICHTQRDDRPENSLLYYMRWYIDSRKEMICQSTYLRYNVFFQLLERFEGSICKRMYVDQVNFEFVRDFLIFGKQEEYSENTIYRTIHFVKTILNFAERKGIRTAVRELEIRREKQQREIITLNEKEILKIKATDVPKEFQAAKDWLLISCYTGQRFSDFMNFERKQLKTIEGKLCLSFTQKKTKKKILLPLHPTVINTLQKNEGNFPHVIDIRHYNYQIKKIARLACVSETVKARKRCGFRSRDVEMDKCEILTSHIGRRSFATNFYGKIPTPLLMDATGHSTEQMFLRYINPVDKDRILSLSDYFDRMYSERDAG